MSCIRVLVIALTLSAVLASGCGSTSNTLSRAELIAKADAICHKVNETREVHEPNTNSEPVSVRQQKYARTLMLLSGYEKAAVVQFHKLVPPSSMAKDWNQIVANVQAFAEGIAKVSSYVSAGNVSAAEQFIAPAKAAQELVIVTAKRDGFHDCWHTSMRTA